MDEEKIDATIWGTRIAFTCVQRVSLVPPMPTRNASEQPLAHSDINRPHAP